MFFATKARLKISEDNNKLEIYRRPGIFAWLFLAISIIMFYGIFNRLTKNYFAITLFLLGVTMFGLDKLGDWEYFVLDKFENRAKFARSNWNDKLLCLFGSAEDPGNLSMKLNEIRHVGVSADLGLFLLLKNGRTTSLSTNNLNRDEIQSLRQEINRFINLARIEYLDKIPNPDHNLGDRLLIPSSDSEEEILTPEITESNKQV